MEKVRELRERRGWNQTELAFHAGLAPSVISQIENGKRNPSASTLKKLAGALEVGVGELFSGKVQPPLFDDAEQRRSASVDSLTSYVLGRARDWEANLPDPEDLSASPQLAFDVLSRYGPVQAEAFALLAFVEKELRDARRAKPSAAEEARWQEEGVDLLEMGARRNDIPYTGLTGTRELFEASVRVAAAVGGWSRAVRHARDAVRDVAELRPDLALVDEGIEKAEEKGQNMLESIVGLRRAS